MNEPPASRISLDFRGARIELVHEPAPGLREPFSAAEKGSRSTVLVVAPGAGTGMDHPSMLRRCAALRARGLSTVRFDFPYRAAGRARPDPMPVLAACFEQVAMAVRRELSPPRLVFGGHSMGGRAASMLAAERPGPGAVGDGVLLMSYPLHPAGDEQRLRSGHLSRIRAPVLCVNGTRDALCRRDLMDAVVATLPPTFTMRWIEGADHSLHVLKRSGRSDDDVLDEVAGVTRDWAGRLAATDRE